MAVTNYRATDCGRVVPNRFGNRADAATKPLVGEVDTDVAEAGRDIAVVPTLCTRPSLGRIMLITLVMAVGILLLQSGVTSTARASIQAPSVRIDPSSGQPGIRVTASATGYGACLPGGTSDGPLRGISPSVEDSGAVAFVWDGFDQLDVAKVSKGSASATFVVPESAEVGVHEVNTECVTNSDLTASTVFTVEPPVEIQEPLVSVEPPSGQPGTSVTAVATGYGGCGPSGDDVGNGTVAFLWDGIEQLARELSGGSASATLVVPESAAIGDHDVGTRCVAGGGFAASTVFTVEPPVEIAVIVPNLVGLSVERATSRLIAENLRLGEVSGDGDVIEDQNPQPGTEVPEDSAVDITVIQVEPELVIVPNLVGLNVADVPGVLAQRGLELGQKSGDGDVVHSQRPKPGSRVPPGSAVGISVERESKVPPLVAVPDLTGMGVDEAGAAVAAAGLVLGDNPDSDGDVMSQQPEAGTLVPAGTAVTLTLTGVGTETPSAPVAAAALVLTLALGAALAVFQASRASRDRRWLRKHIRLVPRAAPTPGFDVREFRTGRSAPTLVVRLEPHPDSGMQVLEEVPP